MLTSILQEVNHLNTIYFLNMTFTPEKNLSAHDPYCYEVQATLVEVEILMPQEEKNINARKSAQFYLTYEGEIYPLTKASIAKVLEISEKTLTQYINAVKQLAIEREIILRSEYEYRKFERQFDWKHDAEPVRDRYNVIISRLPWVNYHIKGEVTKSKKLITPMLFYLVVILHKLVQDYKIKLCRIRGKEGKAPRFSYEVLPKLLKQNIEDTRKDILVPYKEFKEKFKITGGDENNDYQNLERNTKKRITRINSVKLPEKLNRKNLFEAMRISKGTFEMLEKAAKAIQVLLIDTYPGHISNFEADGKKLSVGLAWLIILVNEHRKNTFNPKLRSGWHQVFADSQNIFDKALLAQFQFKFDGMNSALIGRKVDAPSLACSFIREIKEGTYRVHPDDLKSWLNN